jgi:3-isopropylmalate/(R)-2-methylmalate dehydratase large subunit
MGMTIIEKILAKSSGQEKVGPGDIVVCDVDMTVLLDLPFSSHGRWYPPLSIHDPDAVAIVMDHAVPASRISDAVAGTTAREFAEKFGIEKFFDIGRHGICHQVIAEEGLVLPGELLACTDSHTCAAGALNAAARGMGGAEIVQIVCTGKTWHKVAPTIRYELVGEKPPTLSGKDIFLHIAGEFGAANNHNVEFGGPALASIPMNDRRTMAAQGAEIGADFTTFPADEICLEYLEGRAGHQFSPIWPDEDAEYAVTTEIDVSQLRPMVGKPGSVISNAVPVTEVEGTKIDQCFIGSCANGQIEDLAIAAEIVAGRQVAKGVRLIVTPASQKTYLQAVEAGYVSTLVQAGAVVTNSTCGACFGYHMGVLGPGEVCLTASTRNFKGRMGSPDAEIYMASPATVASSAIAGCITEPAMVGAAS